MVVQYANYTSQVDSKVELDYQPCFEVKWTLKPELCISLLQENKVFFNLVLGGIGLAPKCKNLEPI